MLLIQLKQRSETYMRGPEARRGGAKMWGIKIAEARDAGLDVTIPKQGQTKNIQLEADKDGNIT
jgi:hypothetical protein